MVNILPADTYTVINKTILTENDRKILTMLYQPIIGSDSINLFFTFWMDLDKNEFMSMEENHHHLMTSMSMPLDKIVSAREKLEAIGLLRTFYKEKEDSNNYVYELFSPITPGEFFSHPVLNIVLYNSVGKSEYERIINYFKVPRVNLNDYQDISKSFDDIFSSRPSSTFENNIQSIRSNNSLGINIDNRVDFDYLFSIMPKETISEKTFSKDIRKLLNDLSWVYDLSTDELKNIILSSLNNKNMIDKTTLRKNARNYYQYQNKGKLPSLVFQNQPEYLRSPIGKDSKKAKVIYTFETTSPYNFLRSKNNGAKPTDRDLKLIENLRIDLELQPAVINVLLDYALRVNNNKLNKNFIETIAGQWKRLNIETAEEAMNQALKESKKKTTKTNTYSKKEPIVPEWFGKEYEKENVTEEEEKTMKDLINEFNK
jgi:replication initiation and membrane attachment protein